MDPERVVEVWVPALGRVGSGYLLTEQLVLTSYHVVQGLPAGSPVEVRPLEIPQRTPWLAASLSWAAEPVDLAAAPEQDAVLLVIDAPGWRPAPLPGSIRFGEITGPDRVACQGLGFPDAEARPDGRRDTMPVRGHVEPLQARKSRMLTVHVDAGIVPRRRDAGSGWSGASGTALFCGPLLVGVLATHRDIADTASVLGAVPLAELAGLPGFRTTLASHGIDLRIEPAPLPATERFLNRYLEAAFQAADTHPYPVIWPNSSMIPSLTTVYLRQELRRDPDRADPPGPHPQDASAESAPQVLSADAVLAHNGPGIVVADAGGGKSSLLRTWTMDLIRGYAEGPTGQIPVLVQAAQLIPDPDSPHPLPDALAAAVTAELSAYGLDEPLPAAFFRTPPRPDTRWLVLVDGLDEIHVVDARRRLLSMLARQDHRRYRIVVATRPASDQDLDALGQNVPRYTVQPFTPQDLRTVAKAWFAELLPAHDLDVVCEDFLRRLERTRLAELAQVPLMAAMLSQVHATSPGEELPEGRTALYARFVHLLTEHHNSHGPGGLRSQITTEMSRYADPGVLPAALRVLGELPTLLGHLAAERQAGETGPAPDIVADAAPPPRHFDPAQWRSFLTTVLRRSGLLSLRAGELVFLHQTLQEYLAARHTADAPGTRELQRPLFETRRYRWRDGTVGVPHIWGHRYVTPPPDGSASYTAFLLDTDPVGREQHLIRLARHGGLSGCQFLVTLARLTVPLPDAAVRSATGLLHTLALRSDLHTARLKAAEALAQLGDPRTADLWHALALDPSLSDDRVEAAEALAQLGDPRATDLLYTLALGPLIYGHNQLRAVRALEELGDPRIVELLHTLALDPRLDSHYRIGAAEALGHLGDPRAGILLYTVALDTSLIGDDRIRAAKALGQRGDPRAAGLLYALALDPGLSVTVIAGEPRHSNSIKRMEAAEAVQQLGDPRAADLWHTLALLPGLYPDSRMEAAQALTQLGDPRAAGLWHTLALDSHLPDTRVQAAESVQQLGDPRAIDLWHTLALDPRLPERQRRRAAEAAAQFDGPRAAHQENLHRSSPDIGGRSPT